MNWGVLRANWGWWKGCEKGDGVDRAIKRLKALWVFEGLAFDV